MFCKKIKILYPVLAIVVFAVKGYAQSITLDQAIEYAIKHNPKIKQYNEKLEQKKYSDFEALGNFLP